MDCTTIERTNGERGQFPTAFLRKTTTRPAVLFGMNPLSYAGYYKARQQVLDEENEQEIIASMNEIMNQKGATSSDEKEDPLKIAQQKWYAASEKVFCPSQGSKGIVISHLYSDDEDMEASSEDKWKVKSSEKSSGSAPSKEPRKEKVIKGPLTPPSEDSEMDSDDSARIKTKLPDPKPPSEDIHEDSMDSIPSPLLKKSYEQPAVEAPVEEDKAKKVVEHHSDSSSGTDEEKSKPKKKAKKSKKKKVKKHKAKDKDAKSSSKKAKKRKNKHSDKNSDSSSEEEEEADTSISRLKGKKRKLKERKKKKDKKKEKKDSSSSSEDEAEETEKVTKSKKKEKAKKKKKPRLEENSSSSSSSTSSSSSSSSEDEEDTKKTKKKAKSKGDNGKKDDGKGGPRKGGGDAGGGKSSESRHRDEHHDRDRSNRDRDRNRDRDHRRDKDRKHSGGRKRPSLEELFEQLGENVPVDQVIAATFEAVEAEQAELSTLLSTEDDNLELAALLNETCVKKSKDVSKSDSSSNPSSANTSCSSEKQARDLLLAFDDDDLLNSVLKNEELSAEALLQSISAAPCKESAKLSPLGVPSVEKEGSHWSNDSSMEKVETPKLSTSGYATGESECSRSVLSTISGEPEETLTPQLTKETPPYVPHSPREERGNTEMEVFSPHQETSAMPSHSRTSFRSSDSQQPPPYRSSKKEDDLEVRRRYNDRDFHHHSHHHDDKFHHRHHPPSSRHGRSCSRSIERESSRSRSRSLSPRSRRYDRSHRYHGPPSHSSRLFRRDERDDRRVFHRRPGIELRDVRYRDDRRSRGPRDKRDCRDYERGRLSPDYFSPVDSKYGNGSGPSRRYSGHDTHHTMDEEASRTYEKSPPVQLNMADSTTNDSDLAAAAGSYGVSMNPDEMREPIMSANVEYSQMPVNIPIHEPPPGFRHDSVEMTVYDEYSSPPRRLSLDERLEMEMGIKLKDDGGEAHRAYYYNQGQLPPGYHPGQASNFPPYPGQSWGPVPVPSGVPAPDFAKMGVVPPPGAGVSNMGKPPRPQSQVVQVSLYF